MRFKEYKFSTEVQKGIDRLGFTRPTDIQYKAISPILRGEDVLAVAQTGTGKTAAFAIPITHILHQRKKKERRADGIKCIVLVPTHELALQITNVFEEIGRHSNVKVMGLIGGVEQDPQIQRLQKRVDILIATPGRMFDLIAQGHLRVERVEILVLDEADHMLDLGFIKDIRDLVHKLPRKRQTLFFSATINQNIKQLAYKIVRQNAIRIRISPKDPVSKNVDHKVAFVEMDDKRFFLERLIKENEGAKTLVFVRTRVRAERVAKAMGRVDIPALAIHGEKEQKERSEVLAKFRSGEVLTLIATDVTARGIDIPDVEYVVNYDLPDVPENYVHRVGRTGRGKRRGKAIAFCSEDEKINLVEIEEYIGKDVERMEISRSDYKKTKKMTDDKSTNPLSKIMEEIEAFEQSKKKKRKKK